MKKAMLKIALLMMSLSPVAVLAQQVVATAGGSGSGTGVQISWTIGEPVIETFTGSSHILTQGFHQTRLVVTAADQVDYPGLTLTVYPNPVSSSLRLEIIGEVPDNLSYAVYTAEGKLVAIKQVEKLPDLINMEMYTPGIYLLNIMHHQGQPLKTFKIVKN